jgi:hypothetical protein
LKFELEYLEANEEKHEAESVKADGLAKEVEVMIGIAEANMDAGRGVRKNSVA